MNLPPGAAGYRALLLHPAELPDGAEIVSEGGFLCAVCGNEAGHFFFISEENRLYSIMGRCPADHARMLED